MSNGDGSYNFPCNFAGPVGISFPNAGNLNFAIADLNLGRVSNTMCQGAVQGMDVQDANGSNFAIVGDAFIKSYYTLFKWVAGSGGNGAALTHSFGSNTVGFTPAKNFA